MTPEELELLTRKMDVTEYNLRQTISDLPSKEIRKLLAEEDNEFVKFSFEMELEIRKNRKWRAKQ